MPLAGTDLVADQALQASGDLPIRLRAYYHVPHLLTLEDFLGMGLQQGFGTDMFRVGGVKIFVDVKTGIEDERVILGDHVELGPLRQVSFLDTSGHAERPAADDPLPRRRPSRLRAKRVLDLPERRERGRVTGDLIRQRVTGHLVDPQMPAALDPRPGRCPPAAAWRST